MRHIHSYPNSLIYIYIYISSTLHIHIYYLYIYIYIIYIHIYIYIVKTQTLNPTSTNRISAAHQKSLTIPPIGFGSRIDAHRVHSNLLKRACGCGHLQNVLELLLPSEKSWLVVRGIPTPLKNMTKSIGMMIIPNIWKNKSHVPKQQPDGIS